jgi:hypothetical protein
MISVFVWYRNVSPVIVEEYAVHRQVDEPDEIRARCGRAAHAAALRSAM